MQITVLGAGTMGQGIAHVSAMAGHDVKIRDIEEEIVADALTAIEQTLTKGVELGKVDEETATATMERLRGTTALEPAVTDADLVIEAVPENIELKRETMQAVEAVVDTETVLASNTSSLPLTEIASAVTHSERVIGLHFFNPVHLMGLVEIVVPEQANEETVAFAHEFVADIGKTGIEVTDSPGFASSRLGVSLGLEAMRMLESGVASPRDIDTAMELGYNHPVGPLELTDIVGLDVRLGVLEHLREELGERFRPPQILKQKVRAGNLGKKTGEGFYIWDGDDRIEPSGDWGEN